MSSDGFYSLTSTRSLMAAHFLNRLPLDDKLESLQIRTSSRYHDVDEITCSST